MSKIIEAKKVEVGGYCNVQAFQEFGVWSTELTLRREKREGDIHVTARTEPVMAYNTVGPENQTDQREE